MTETVRVGLGERSYDILVGRGVLETVGKELAVRNRSRRAIVVTDTSVAPLYLEKAERALGESGFRIGKAIILPAGEKTKSFSVLEGLLDDILVQGIDRSTVLVALGGGVIGDITGFASAITLRGLDFVQVPTTLLSQVDSSVGGKTGINTRHGKNLVGAFHQPRLVIADTALLDTLPRRQVLAGYAEIVKYGLIDKPDFFAWLEERGEAVCAGDADARIQAVVTSCQSKAAIVEQDEHEGGVRALLNLGHTFGHALEAATGFGDVLLHGEGVAIGMVLAFELSSRLGLCPPEDVKRVRAHLAKVGLPVDAAPYMKVAGIDAAGLVALMSKDKKVQDGQLTFILARGIGQAFVARHVDSSEVLALLNSAVSAKA